MKKEMTEREVRILKEAGVAWVDLDKLEKDISVASKMGGKGGGGGGGYDLDRDRYRQYPQLTTCNTNLTNLTQPTLQTHVSNTSYAEKEITSTAQQRMVIHRGNVRRMSNAHFEE